MPLTVKEKEHWKEQIEKRIEKAIAKAYRDEGNEWRLSLQEKSYTEASKRLGLTNYMDKYKQLEAKLGKLRAEQAKLVEATEKPFKDSINENLRWVRGHELIDRVVKNEAKVVEVELLEGSDSGQKILRLKREKEELLDTIWLATSPVQIRSLWKDFTNLVAAEPTELQKQAMTYAPSETE